MNHPKKEYMSLRHLAIKYDLHPDTIRKQNLIQGVHYLRIGRSIRYHVDNIHDFFCNSSTKKNEQFDLDRFLIEQVI